MKKPLFDDIVPVRVRWRIVLMHTGLSLTQALHDPSHLLFAKGAQGLGVDVPIHPKHDHLLGDRFIIGRF